MSDPTYTLAAVHHAGYCYYPDDDRRRSAVRELSLRRELDDRLRRGIQAERVHLEAVISIFRAGQIRRAQLQVRDVTDLPEVFEMRVEARSPASCAEQRAAFPNPATVYPDTPVSTVIPLSPALDSTS